MFDFVDNQKHSLQELGSDVHRRPDDIALFKQVIFTTIVLAILLSLSSPAIAHKTKSRAAPVYYHVDLADLLDVAGPFQTFLGYLRKTSVIQTLQNQADNTKVSITMFVPRDSAFAELKTTRLTKGQIKSLLLYHAIPKFYSLNGLSELGRRKRNPVATFAGLQYTLNLTEYLGTIRVKSMASNAKIISAIYSRAPVSVYEVDKVLLPWHK